MGACNGSPSGGMPQREPKKLLLIGSPGSGKTTLFKQFTVLYGKGLTQAARDRAKANAMENVLRSMKLLISLVGEELPADQQAHRTAVMESEPHDFATAKSVKALWELPVVRAAYDANKFLVLENTEYLMGKLDKMFTESYQMTDEDVFRIRAATRVMSHIKFFYEGFHYEISDMKGLRGVRVEARHIENLRQNTTAALFVVSAASFDEKAQPGEKHPVTKSLELFEKTTRQFGDVPTILLLNKDDMLKQKLSSGIGLNAAFPEYTGGLDYEASVAFLKDQFAKRYPKGKKGLYIFTTCATDSDIIHKVWIATSDIVIKSTFDEEFG